MSSGTLWGTTGGQRRALQKFDISTRIDISKLTKKRSFKNRSKSLQNHSIKLCRQGRPSSRLRKLNKKVIFLPSLLQSGRHNGRRWKMMEEEQVEKIRKHVFSKSCRGPSEDLRWGTNSSAKIRSAPKFQLFGFFFGG